MSDDLSVNALELWRGDKRLVNELSFSASAGTFLRIGGLNGVGKTTLLRAIAGLTHPESGQVCWAGKNIHNDLSAYHSNLAWLGHRDGLKPELSAKENLQQHQRVQGRPEDTLKTVMQDANIWQLADLPVRSLSAGQKRRVAFTRVIASTAKLWLLDEPFANLDTDGQHWGLDHMRRHVADGGICVLSTHLSFDDANTVTVDLSA